MEPALIRNQNCTSGALPSPLPATASLAPDQRRPPGCPAHPVFGTETVGLATDLSATRRALSSISCCGGDRRPVHPTLQRLRGCSFNSGHPASLRQPDIEPTVLAWKNGQEATRITTLAALPLTQLRFASCRRAEHRPLSSLVRRPAAARVDQDGSRRRSCHGAWCHLTRADSGLDGPPRPCATLTVLCERVGSLDKTRPDNARSRHCKRP
jgi:hypothetical protein